MKIEKIFFLALIPILIATGFFLTPNIVSIRQGDYNICPKNIINGDEFRLKFKNTGPADASLIVTIFSDEINFTVPTDTLTVPHNNDITPFILKLDKESIPEGFGLKNITIGYSYKYNKFFFIKLLCEYECYYHSGDYMGIVYDSESKGKCLITTS